MVICLWVSRRGSGESLKVGTTTLEAFSCGGAVKVYELITVTNGQLHYKDYWECTKTTERCSTKEEYITLKKLFTPYFYVPVVWVSQGSGDEGGSQTGFAFLEQVQ